MWQHLFDLHLSVGEKIVRTVLVYALVAVLLRLTGKRGLAGLNTLDIVVMTLLSNVVQNAIIGDDLTVTGGAIGAVTLVLVNAAMNRLAVSSVWFGKVFDGTDSTVITDGRVDVHALRRLGVTRTALDHAVRLQNGEDVTQVERGVMEPGGQLLLTLRGSEQSASKADVARIEAQLTRIEQALSAGPRSAGTR